MVGRLGGLDQEIAVASQTCGLKGWLVRRCTVVTPPPDQSYRARFVYQRWNHVLGYGSFSYNVLFGRYPSSQLLTLQKSEHRNPPGCVDRQPPSHPWSLAWRGIQVESSRCDRWRETVSQLHERIVEIMSELRLRT